VNRGHPGEIVELGAAREAVGEDHRVRPGCAYGGQQAVLGDRDGHLVVPLLHPEVPGQPAAAADPGHRRTGPGEQPRIGLPPQDGRVVAVGLGDDRRTAEVRRRPAGQGLEVERSGAHVVGPVPLPTKIERFTIRRSAFIDKDSHEHFEIRTHNRLIDVLDPDSKTIDMLMRLNLPAGVDIEIKI
jgi:small subunit ribosomal protein S10